MSNLSYTGFALVFALLIINVDGNNIKASDGCEYGPNSAMFNQVEEDSAPKENWGWQRTTNISTVANNDGWPIYK